MICIIQGHGFVNREVVLYYFAGMCEQFMREAQASFFVCGGDRMDLRQEVKKHLGQMGYKVTDEQFDTILRSVKAWHEERIKDVVKEAYMATFR